MRRARRERSQPRNIEPPRGLRLSGAPSCSAMKADSCRSEKRLTPNRRGGPTGRSQVDTLGSWAFNEDLTETVTVLAGLRNKVGSQAQLTFAPGVEISRKFPSPFAQLSRSKPPAPWTLEQAKAELRKAADLAGSSDLTILVLGETQVMSGEAASRNLSRSPAMKSNCWKR